MERLSRVTTRHAARLIREALTPPDPDPQRVSSPVHVYGPDGALRETVAPADWATRYPRRLTPRARRG